MVDLAGKITIVTGGAWGIGRAISLACSHQGSTVVIADIHADRGVEVVEQITMAGNVAQFIACDVADSVQVATMVEQTIASYGHLDVLINNAGIPGTNEPAHELSIEEWDRVMAVNLRGPFVCAKYAIPHLIASGNGAIVNIASTFGLVGAIGSGAYCASKGGLITFTKQLAVEYGGQLRVNAVCPGFIDTDMADRRTRMTLELAAANLAARESAAALQPIGRQADPAEVAEAVVFLASDRASFMTGSIVTVDGGCTATYNSGPRG